MVARAGFANAFQGKVQYFEGKTNNIKKKKKEGKEKSCTAFLAVISVNEDTRFALLLCRQHMQTVLNSPPPWAVTLMVSYPKTPMGGMGWGGMQWGADPSPQPRLGSEP